MVHEIYTRANGDKYYEDHILEFTNEVEEVITQLRTLLTSHPGEVLGTYDFGTELDYYVFGTIRNAREITNDINELIRKFVYIGKNMSVNTEINFGKDERNRDYAVLDVYINGAKSVGFLIDKD